MLLLESLVFLPEGVDTIDHGLDESNFRVERSFFRHQSTFSETYSEVAVTRDEEEVVVDQLLADLLVHGSQGVVRASEVTGQLAKGALHQLLNGKTSGCSRKSLS